MAFWLRVIGSLLVNFFGNANDHFYHLQQLSILSWYMQCQALCATARQQKLREVYRVNLKPFCLEFASEGVAASVHYHAVTHNDGVGGETVSVVVGNLNKAWNVSFQYLLGIRVESGWIVGGYLWSEWAQAGIQMIKVGIGQMQRDDPNSQQFSD